MDKRYSKKGLKVIAPEVQRSPVDAINEIVEDGKIEYTVTAGISGPNLARGIPHMAVFDTKGKLVWNGHPMDDAAEDAIKDALKDAVAGDDPKSSSGLGERKFLIDERAWTNTEGKTMSAAVLSVTGDTVKFRFSNGQVFDYDINKLSEADQKAIKEAVGGSEEEADE